jgi:signal transduction histidine kinase
VSTRIPAPRAGQLSDDTARRLAWAAFGVVLAGYLGAVLAGFMPDRRTDPDAPWGWHEFIGDAIFGTAMLVFPVVGLTIARQQPRNRIGWLLLAIGFAWMGTGFNDLYVRYAALTDPGSLPRPDVVAVLAEGSWVFAVGLLGTFLILLFPDGHLPSRRWRAVAWASGISIGFIYLLVLVSPGRTTESDVPFRNPFGIQALKPLGEAVYLPILSLPLCILACAVALVMRYRRSTGVERLQLKWLATSGALFAVTYLFAMVHGALSTFDFWGGGGAGWSALIDASFAVWFALIPVSIGFAVLKHRLYEIDVVINRAVVFGALAVFITAVYVAIVVGVGAALGQGDRPNIALSIAATAVVAVAFQPVRERVQRFANRLVYGRRATPYEVMANFAVRMGGAYGATDLVPRMARTIADGVSAKQVEVWLKIGRTFVREATWPESSPGPLTVPGDGSEIPDVAGDRVVPVRHQGELLGLVTVTKAPGEPLTPAEEKLLDDVASQAGLVLRNVRLIEELRSSRQRLVTSQDDERRRLERNLHDGAQQSLVTVALILRMAKDRLSPDSANVAASLDQASELLSTAIEELRELARGIHPAILTERGLGPALSSLAERSQVPVHLAYGLASRPPAAVEATVYFVVMEALANVAKYAEASTVEISVEQDGSELLASISDNGIGGADAAKGTGLRGLADRVAVVDGNLEVDSPPGGGTRLTCRIPLEPAVAAETPPAASLPREPVAVGGGDG